MRNIIRTDVSLKLFVVLSFFAFIGCQKQIDDSALQKDYATIMLDVDKVTLESANIRIRHNGPADLLWVYMNTSDMDSDAALLIQEKVAHDLELTKEIVAYTGQNKSLSVLNLKPKCYYRFICSAIDEVTGLPCGEVVELEYRTRRDPSVFEKNAAWSISQGDRFVNNLDQKEYDKFICDSDDEQSYMFFTLKDSDIDYYYKGDLCALFDDYHSSLGLAWKEDLHSGDATCTEQRLRSGDWTAFMLGIDPDGELSGMYQEFKFKIEQEKATEAYNRWCGTWEVSNSDGQVLFEIEILPSENNMWYYMAGWESDNVYHHDTFDPAFMPELFFDKVTGELCFISQYVNTLVDVSDSYDFFFTGTFIYAGNTYVLGSEVLNYRMADAGFLDTSYTTARIESCDFTTQGMTFPINSICYMYSAAGQLGSISLITPTLPLNMSKVK